MGAHIENIEHWHRRLCDAYIDGIGAGVPPAGSGHRSKKRDLV